MVPTATDHTLATDPARPLGRFAATPRDPARLAAALGAFLRAVAPGPSTRPIVTVADDAWIVEGFHPDQAAYARLTVPRAEFAADADWPLGTTAVALGSDWPDAIGGGWRVRLEGSTDPADFPPATGPPGWLRGFAGMMAALSLPMGRIPVDRGGLFGLVAALGPGRSARAGRSIAVAWRPGRPAEAVVGAGMRPVALHARAGVDGPGGGCRVAVGHALASLAGVLPWGDAAALLRLGPGLPTAWAVRLGGIELLLGLPSWTSDGRLGALALDAVAPPVEPGRFLANQVVATFRAHPTQARAEVVARTRAPAAEVAAVLLRLAELGQVLSEPEADRFRWRAAWGDATDPLDDPEPAEATAARGILRTTSLQVTRDEPTADGRGRRLEGTILDRPVALDLDADGWMRAGRCTCSHHAAGGLRRGPCRHLLAFQARAAAPPDRPRDLADWYAGFPAPIPV